MHLNDSRHPGRRTSELIGQGEIGLDGIKAIVNHPRLVISMLEHRG